MCLQAGDTTPRNLTWGCLQHSAHPKTPHATKAGLLQKNQFILGSDASRSVWMEMLPVVWGEALKNLIAPNQQAGAQRRS